MSNDNVRLASKSYFTKNFVKLQYSKVVNIPNYAEFLLGHFKKVTLLAALKI